MSDLKLTPSDVDLHILHFGMDVFPPIEIRNERTRLNMFYEEVRSKWPDLFDRLETSDTLFNIWKEVRSGHRDTDPAHPIPTFSLTQRGPVIRFPLRLPDPVGQTSFDRESLPELFHSIRDVFFGKLPTLKILRTGVIRELVFQSGKSPTLGMLGTDSSFGNAQLQGGVLRSEYRDSKCNILVTIQPVQAIRATALPIGQVVHQPAGFGLGVQLDVNNAELKPMEKPQIDEVIERANSFWPDILLEYLGRRTGS